MILCSSCFHVWPSNAKYCGHCRKSFGSRLCPHGHKSPAVAKVCVECASGKLSTPTAYLSLRPISCGCLIVLFLIAGKWIFKSAGVLAFHAFFGPINFLFQFLIFLGVIHLILGKRANGLFTVYKIFFQLVGAIFRAFSSTPTQGKKPLMERQR